MRRLCFAIVCSYSLVSLPARAEEDFAFRVLYARDQRPELHESALLANAGGAVVAAGEYNVELVVRQNGQIEAAVLSWHAEQAKLVKSIFVKICTQKQGVLPVVLGWNPSREIFSGALPAGVEPRSGPVSLRLDLLQGQNRRAKHAQLAVLPTPRYGGVVFVTGKYAFEVLARKEGLVIARRRDSEEEPLPHNAELIVTPTSQGDTPFPLSMKWNPTEWRYEGRTPLGIRLKSGRILVSVFEPQGVEQSSFRSACVMSRNYLSGKLIVAGEHCIELIRRPQAIEALVLDTQGTPARSDLIDVRMAVEDSAGEWIWIDVYWNTYYERYVAALPESLTDASKVHVAIDTRYRVLPLHAAEFSHLETGAIDLVKPNRPALDRLAEKHRRAKYDYRLTDLVTLSEMNPKNSQENVKKTTP